MRKGKGKGKRRASKVKLVQGKRPLYSSKHKGPYRINLEEHTVVTVTPDVVAVPEASPELWRKLRLWGIHESQPAARHLSRKPRTLLARECAGKTRKTVRGFLDRYLKAIREANIPDDWYVRALVALGRWQRRMGGTNGWYPIPWYGPSIEIPDALSGVLTMDGPD